MKSVLAFVALVGLIGFSVWQHGKISSLNDQIASLTQQLSAARVPRAPNPTNKIICPLCHGERVVAYTLPGETKLHTQNEPCPVCLGLGYRMLKILPGYKICPDCQGMAIVFGSAEPGHRVPHDNCGRCGATGLVADTK